ncbi:MAG: cation:proton antiporter [Candidatus Levybacteria bacterium]|nr:cation:proton antiporter [Candidatus Levybacteria bacterium]
MSGILFEVTVIICFAALISIIFRFLKQPPILAYILTGIIIGPFGQLQLQNHADLRMMAQFGITLLLFMLGLELKLKDLRSIGSTAFFIGIPQIILTAALGYFISFLLGFSLISSFYIAVALSFSSTIIIVKLLSAKKDLQSLYGKISIGMLLIQDFFAVFVLIFLSVFNKGSQELLLTQHLALIIVKAILLFAFVIFLSKKVFPLILDKLARSEETLILFSLAWVLGLSALVSSQIIGFSIEIGGFLAGVALANSKENFQIIARVRALQDFFITIFFVVLGMEAATGDLGKVLVPALIFSVFVILGKPLIIMIIMGLFGHRKRTSLLTGIHMAQISEFSLIIIFLGSKLGHVTNDIVILMTTVGLVTFAASTYMSTHANSFYKHTKNYLGIFEIGKIREGKEESEGLDDLSDHVALIGANRMGSGILDALLEEGEKVIVVDFDPDIIKDLKEKGVISIFGDISDIDIQQRLQLHRAKLVISTVSDVDDNILLIDGLHHTKNLPALSVRQAGERQVSAKIIVVAQDFDDAKKLYDAGADYVVIPHIIGGKHLAKMIKENTLDKIDGRKSSKDFMRLG